jgi:hypothetical protein
VGSGGVVLVSQFLQQLLQVTRNGDADAPGGSRPQRPAGRS